MSKSVSMFTPQSCFRDTYIKAMQNRLGKWHQWEAQIGWPAADKYFTPDIYLCIYVVCVHKFMLSYSLRITAPPQFIIHPMNRTVEINNESTAVVLTCRANKTSSYRWEIPKGVNQSNVVGIRSESLVLHNVLPSYNGNYQCVAENMYGKNYSKHATLLIAGII